MASDPTHTSDLAAALLHAHTLHDRIADDVPQLRRGKVWCHRCGHVQRVDAAGCLRRGWPKHCGETMSIDSPEEREAHRAKARR